MLTKGKQKELQGDLMIIDQGNGESTTLSQMMSNIMQREEEQEATSSLPLQQMEIDSLYQRWIDIQNWINSNLMVLQTSKDTIEQVHKTAQQKLKLPEEVLADQMKDTTAKPRTYYWHVMKEAGLLKQPEPSGSSLTKQKGNKLLAEETGSYSYLKYYIDGN
ncbi:hypothetical protein B0J17DRAFT_633882 [Rhizoctonia solani]|nr:hypothetical protein B0J17DRAFT_633882 [Rhizoctonia solani]